MMSSLLLLFLLANPSIEDPLQQAVLAGDTEQASKLAETILKGSPEEPRAQAVMALGKWIRWAKAAYFWGRKLSTPPSRHGLRHRRFMRGLVNEIPGAGDLIMQTLVANLLSFDAQLGEVIKHLETADREEFSLLIQPAAFAFDLNVDGKLDKEERSLFEVEYTAEGALLPSGDPGRRPIFRLDRGDIRWALAYLSFQRALAQAALAYDIAGSNFRQLSWGRSARFRLKEPERIKVQVKALIKAGLAHSRAARLAYLEEKDDEREWIPNPKQSQHGIPLKVDELLYQRWEKALSALDDLVESRTALDIDEICTGVAKLLGPQTDAESKAFLKPSGHGQRIDLGRMLSEPRSIDLNLRGVITAPNLALSLEAAFPNYLSKEKPASILPRLIFESAKEAPQFRAKGQRNLKGAMGHKARYLLWIN